MHGCRRRHAARGIAPALALFALTAWLFWPATANDFTAYDDDAYVTRNVWVLEGLQPAGMHWALTTFHEGNWHPLAWLSHMLDVTLFGLDPFGHHLASVLLHAANASLLFFFLLRATGAAGRSALVAALFAAHPLHVESVVWVAERKDVLCAFVWLLTLLAYVAYQRRPGTTRYLGVVALFALALLSKAMAVTLPFALLLLDFWPLGRWLPPPAGVTAPSRRHWPGLLREKIPLFLLAAAAGVVALAAQARGGALGSLETFPLPVRAANALVSYGTYLLHAFWPRDLAVIYPHPHAVPPSWHWLGASVALCGVTVCALRGIRARPWLLSGWLWYLGTLIPVIGLVQIGIQARSDRYTYLPLVGIFVALIWAAAALGRRGLSTAAAAGCIGMMLAALAAAARIQIGYWRDDAALFEHAVAAVKDNRLAHLTRGVHLAAEGRHEEAQRHYAAASFEGNGSPHGTGTAPGPQLPDAPGLAGLPPEARENYRLGNELARGGRFAEAVRHYESVLRPAPGFAPARNNLGVALAALGDRAGASAAFREAARQLPASAEPLVNIGNLLALSGDSAGARDSFRRALSLQPDSPVAHFNLGDVLLGRGERYRALFEYREVLRIDPGNGEARQRLESEKGGGSSPGSGRPARREGTMNYLLFP